MKKSVKTFLLLFLSFVIIISLIPMNVLAEEEDTTGKLKLIVEPQVDPRVKALEATIYVEYYNTVTYETVGINIYATSNYRTSKYVEKGDYLFCGGMVYGDTSLTYLIKGDDFDGNGKTAVVKPIVGDPNYTGEMPKDADKGKVDGAIDRDKTNELREEAGQDPIDWDKEAALRDPTGLEPDYSGIVDADGNDANHKGQENPHNLNAGEENPGDNNKPSDNKDPIDSSNQNNGNTGNNDGTTNDGDQNSIPGQNEITPNKKGENSLGAGTTWGSIIFIVILLGGSAIAIYFRRKNAPLDDEDVQYIENPNADNEEDNEEDYGEDETEIEDDNDYEYDDESIDE